MFSNFHNKFLKILKKNFKFLSFLILYIILIFVLYSSSSVQFVSYLIPCHVPTYSYFVLVVVLNWAVGLAMITRCELSEKTERSRGSGTWTRNNSTIEHVGGETRTRERLSRKTRTHRHVNNCCWSCQGPQLYYINTACEVFNWAEAETKAARSGAPDERKQNCTWGTLSSTQEERVQWWECNR